MCEPDDDTAADPGDPPPTLEELKALGPRDWDDAIEGVAVDDLSEMSRTLDGEIAGLTRLAVYLGIRCGYGHGDQGHAKAVAESNRVVRAVRRALGYHTTPDLTF